MTAYSPFTHARGLILILLLLAPSLSFGAFTEFYCLSGGNNVNGGSDTSTTATFTSTNGNWDTTTKIFIPTDGSNPVSSGVTVGQFASVYLDGATQAVFIARVTAVVNAVNGAITVSTTAVAGTAPSTGVTGRTIKVGGAWAGPVASSQFPFLFGLSALTDSSANRCRVNLKNDQTYSQTGAIGFSTGFITIQGFTSTPGDLGKATLTNSTTGTGYTFASSQGSICADLIFAATAVTGTGTLATNGGNVQTFTRCVFHGARGYGFLATGGVLLTECEWYDNGKAGGGFAHIGSGSGGTATVIYGYLHDGSGTVHGVSVTGTGSVILVNTVIESNGGKGVVTANNGAYVFAAVNCDFYNNGSDAIFLDATDASQNNIAVYNSNFIKNTGGAFNMNDAGQGGVINNVAYGAGTEVNGSDTLRSLDRIGTITYSSNVTPYSASTTGNFSVTLPAAIGTGRGLFTETDGTNTGTVGFPDIGAAQSSHGVLGNEVSYGFGF